MKNNIDIFFSADAFAVVGVSNKKGKFGTIVYNNFKERKLTVYPVNHHYNTFDGKKCYKSIQDLPENVSSIVCVVPPSDTEKIVQQCINTEIKNIWLQPGSDAAEAINLAEQNNLNVIYKQCILMFLEPVKSYHAFHRWINKLFGKYPK